MDGERRPQGPTAVPSEDQIDLRERGSVPAHTLAYSRLRDIGRGELREVVFVEEPTLIMESVSHQLRHEIHWEIVDAGPPVWRVQVRHRDDVPAKSLVDVLERDHLRLDRLFGDALHATNAGDLERAARRLQAFGTGLRRHLQVENEVLAPAFVGPRDAQGNDPTSIMLNEHTELLAQIEMLEAYFKDGLPAAEDVAPLFALLSGQLAKHEAREELNLFPNWGIALRNAPPGAEADVVKRVQGILAGDLDEELGLNPELPSA